MASLCDYRLCLSFTFKVVGGMPYAAAATRRDGNSLQLKAAITSYSLDSPEFFDNLTNSV